MTVLTLGSGNKVTPVSFVSLVPFVTSVPFITLVFPGPGKPGDSFSLGALANGTEVCCVERFPGEGAL